MLTCRNVQFIQTLHTLYLSDFSPYVYTKWLSQYLLKQFWRHYLTPILIIHVQVKIHFCKHVPTLLYYCFFVHMFNKCSWFVYTNILALNCLHDFLHKSLIFLHIYFINIMGLLITMPTCFKFYWIWWCMYLNFLIQHAHSNFLNSVKTTTAEKYCLKIDKSPQ